MVVTYLFIGAFIATLFLFLEHCFAEMVGINEDYDEHKNMDLFIRCCISCIVMLSWPVMLVLVAGLWGRS